jgi:hypothetical protein
VREDGKKQKNKKTTIFIQKGADHSTRCLDTAHFHISEMHIKPTLWAGEVAQAVRAPAKQP